MKKIIIFLIVVSLQTIQSFAQLQNLALLPTKGNIQLIKGGGPKSFKSICVNKNLHPPGKDIFNSVKSEGKINFKVNGKKYPGGYKKSYSGWYYYSGNRWL